MGAPVGNKNQQGRVQRAVLRALARASGTVSKGLDLAADKIVEAAHKGEVWALQMLADRIDGRPHQTVDATVDVTHHLKDADDLTQKLARSLEARVGEPTEPSKPQVH